MGCEVMQNCNNLETVRMNIDQIDRKIVKLISERSFYVKQAARFKKTTDDVKAPARVEAVIDKVKKLAIENDIDPDLIENVYRTMINCFINLEIKEHEKI